MSIEDIFESVMQEMDEEGACIRICTVCQQNIMTQPKVLKAIFGEEVLKILMDKSICPGCLEVAGIIELPDVNDLNSGRIARSGKEMALRKAISEFSNIMSKMTFGVPKDRSKEIVDAIEDLISQWREEREALEASYEDNEGDQFARSVDRKLAISEAYADRFSIVIRLQALNALEGVNVTKEKVLQAIEQADVRDYSHMAQFTPRHAAAEAHMEALLPDEAKLTRKKAGEQRCCVYCGKSIDGSGIIRSKAEAREWGLSLLCGPCWDELIGG